MDILNHELLRRRVPGSSLELIYSADEFFSNIGDGVTHELPSIHQVIIDYLHT